MLSRLVIRNIVLIEALDLSFADGFTVLTGETGAGKSILLDALGLCLGAKGDGALVRQGATSGSASATFVLPPTHPAHDILDGAGFEPDDVLILRRTLTAEGRARAFVNDQPATAALLRSLGQLLVEVHGQHADRSLLDPATHRRLLDGFAGLAGEAHDLCKIWQALKDAKAALKAQEAALAAQREEADYLRASVDELSKLDPEPGEEDRLSAERQTMGAAEKVAGDLASAAQSLEGPKSPIPSLSGVVRKLERKSAGAEEHLGPVIEALATALDVLEDARITVADAQRALDFDPGALDNVEERLFALRAAARKFKVPADDLADLAAQMADALTALDMGEAQRDALEAAVADAQRTYQSAAEALSAKRRQGGDGLAKEVARELGPLKLDKARFFVEQTHAEAGPEGIDRLEFHVQTNPGSPPGPILKVASGGEFSRFLLALKVCLADRGSASTMVFDEIDTGVGGAVSDAIGSRMARLSDGVQVIAVTHAPQVAARAAQHLLIAKEHEDETTTQTSVRAIKGKERREEIARMLAGATITDEARAAAKRLIDA
ncbi:MAG: DNA repair protein RecN [Pseudomonadota bacterium]